jgi:hypothetical protein
MIAAELQPDTLRAWESYIQSGDARMRERLTSARGFLWTDESSDRLARVKRGEIVVAPRVGNGMENVPNGLVHDWIGAAFIPNAKVEDLLAVLQDYDHYKEIYKPVVAESKTLAQNPTDQEFSMVWRRKVLSVSAAMQGRYRARSVIVDECRGYSMADTEEVREIEHYGNGAERLLPPDTGNGYIWRLHSAISYERRDGGVYLEVEAIALTRTIPASLRWLVGSMVNHLSVNSLTMTLRQTRDAVTSKAESPVLARLAVKR